MRSYILKTLLVIMLAVSVNANSARAYESTDIIPIINETTSGADKLNESLTDSSSTAEVRTVVTEMAVIYGTGSAKIAALSPSDEEQTAMQNKLSSQMKTIQNDLNQMLAAPDTAAYNTAYQTYSTDLTAMNATIAENNESMNLSTTDYSPLLWFLTIAFGIISVGLLIASQVGNKLLESAMLQNKMQFELFKGSLWPSIGSLISLIWYSATPPGGTYYLLWGPIAFGAFYFFKQYVAYSSQKKNLKKLRDEETAKIKSLIADR